jgi:hypothetical protein
LYIVYKSKMASIQYGDNEYNLTQDEVAKMIETSLLRRDNARIYSNRYYANHRDERNEKMKQYYNDNIKAITAQRKKARANKTATPKHDIKEDKRIKRTDIDEAIPKLEDESDADYKKRRKKVYKHEYYIAHLQKYQARYDEQARKDREAKKAARAAIVVKFE